MSDVDLGRITATVGLKIDNSGLTSANSMFRAAETSLTGIGTTAKNTSSSISGSFSNSISGASSAVHDFSSSSSGAFKSVSSGAVSAGTSVTGLGSAAKSASDSFGSRGFGGALEQMNVAASGVTASTGAAKFGMQGFSSAVSAMGSTATSSSSSLTGLSLQANSTDTAFSMLGSSATASSNTIRGTLTSGIKNVGSSLTGLVTKTSVFQTLSSGAKGAGSALLDLTHKSVKLKNEMGTMGTVITSVVAGGLVKGLSDVISVYSHFDDQMRQVQAVTSATGDQFKQLTAEATKLGADTSFTAQEVADGMTILGQAGFNADQVMQAMPGTLDLARASMTGLATSVDILTTTMVGFRLQADQTSEVSDILAKTANISATDVTGIGEAMKYTSALAHEMNWSLEETSAAVGELSNAGIKNSMAGTVLRNSITRLIAPTKNVTEALESYGISLEDINPETHKLAEILDLLAEKGVSTGDIMKIFGMRAGPGMLALLAQGSEGLRDYTAQLENADGYAAQAAETMDAGLGGALRQLDGSIETLKISLGDDLAYSLDTVIRLGAKFVNVYQVIPDPIRKVGAALLALGTAGLVVVSGLGTLGLILEAATPALGALGITAVGASAALTGIIAPAAAVAVALVYLDEKTGLISDTMSFLYDAVTVDWYAMKDIIGGVINTVSGYIDNFSSDLGGIATGLHLEGITDYFSEIETAISGYVDSVHQAAEDAREDHERMQYTFDDSGTKVLDVSNIAQDANQQWMESSGLLASAVITDNEDMQNSLGETETAYEKAVGELFTEANTKEAAGLHVMSGVDVDELSRGIKTLSGELIILNDTNELVKVSADGTVTSLRDMGDTHFDTTKGGLDVLVATQDTLKSKTEEADRVIQNTKNDVVVLGDSFGTLGGGIEALPSSPITDIVNEVSGLNSAINAADSSTYVFGSSLVGLGAIKLSNIKTETSDLGMDINASKEYTDQLNFSLGKTDMIPMGQILSNQSALGGQVDLNTGKTTTLNSTLGATNNVPLSNIQANLSTTGVMVDTDVGKTNTLNSTLGSTNASPFNTLFGNLNTSGSIVESNTGKTGNWNSSLSGINAAPFGTLSGNLSSTGSQIDTDKSKADNLNSSMSTLGGFSFGTTLSSLGSIYDKLGDIYDRAKDTISELFKVGSSSSSSNKSASGSTTTSTTNNNNTFNFKTYANPSTVTQWIKRTTGS